MTPASDLTGWVVGYGVGAVVVLAVAALVIAITLTARRIAAVARDATRSLQQTQARTEVLWQVRAVNRLLTDIRRAAASFRTASEVRR